MSISILCLMSIICDTKRGGIGGEYNMDTIKERTNVEC